METSCRLSSSHGNCVSREERVVGQSSYLTSILSMLSVVIEYQRLLASHLLWTKKRLKVKKRAIYFSSLYCKVHVIWECLRTTSGKRLTDLMRKSLWKEKRYIGSSDLKGDNRRRCQDSFFIHTWSQLGYSCLLSNFVKSHERYVG